MADAFTNVHGQAPSEPAPPDFGTPAADELARRHARRVAGMPVPAFHVPVVARYGREEVDTTRCQAPSGHNGVVRVRCSRPATCVAVNNQADGHGAILAAALCDECRKALLAVKGPDYAKITPLAAPEYKLSPDGKYRWKSGMADWEPVP